MKRFFTKRNVYIALFAILYLIVAFSSFWHAIEFFALTNHSWMSIILAFAFEVGQAAVLLAILTSAKERSKFTPWILMCILTLVQIIGNVYSSYKYIMLNASENLRYFKEPIFIWTNLPDAQATVIITYISSAILPLCALLLTSMITNYLEDNNTADTITEPAAEDITDDTVKDNEKETKKENITEEVDKEAEETNVPIEDEPEEEIEEPEDKIEDKPDEENINESNINESNINESNINESHFINI